MTPIPKTFRQRAVLVLNEYGIGHVCQEWDTPNSWQRGGRKEPFCKQQGLCYRPAELKKLREHLHLAKPAWKQAADKVSLQVGVLKSWQEVAQDLPLTKARCSEKELATINSRTCTWHARNGAPNTCRVLLSCSQATSTQQRAALPGVNHRPKTTMVLETPEGGFYIFYIPRFIHSLQPTYRAPHEVTPICPNFYPSPKISLFPY